MAASRALIPDTLTPVAGAERAMAGDQLQVSGEKGPLTLLNKLLLCHIYKHHDKCWGYKYKEDIASHVLEFYSPAGKLSEHKLH